MKLNSLEDLHRLLPGATKPASTPPDRGHDGRGARLRMTLDRKGRKGKVVTLISGLRHNPETMEDIARRLKEKCGTGGTVKDGNIELQGDQREPAGRELERMNYVVK